MNLFLDLYFDVELIYDNILVKIYNSPVASAFSQIFLHYEKITEIRRCDAILRARASR